MINADNDVRIYTLCSGSSGNCTYFKVGADEFLIDAGMSMKGIKTALSSLGTDIERIRAIFITHEHSDHVKGCAMIAKHYGIPIHALEASAPHLGVANESLVIKHNTEYTEQIGDAIITSFPTSHDSAASCGYTVRYGELLIGIATDTGYVSDKMALALRGADAVLLESNYDPDMLRFGPYAPSLKARVASKRGHLSNDECSMFCRYLSDNKTKKILLGHLSAENNTPERALRSALLGVAPCKERAEIAVADRYTPTELFRRG